MREKSIDISFCCLTVNEQHHTMKASLINHTTAVIYGLSNREALLLSKLEAQVTHLRFSRAASQRDHCVCA